MMTSRGIRWSGQTIGIGRRRLEAISARQFSSSTVHHTSFRTNPLLPQIRASIPRTFPQSQIPRSNLIIRNGLSIRFASSIPTSAGISATTMTTATTGLPSEAATSAISNSDFASALEDAAEFSPEFISNIPEHIGYLKEMGLEFGFGPTAMMEWVLEHVHVLAGTPWWISISLTAILVRLVLLKPYINAAENSTKMATIKPITDPLQQQMSALMKAGDTDGAMQARAEMQRINKRAGIKLWHSFVPMLQIFTGYGSFFLIRAMAKIPVPGLETGGILWFYNIAIPDPYFIIPAATALVLHYSIRRGGEMGVSTGSETMQKAMMYGFPAMSFLFTTWLPAGLQISFFITGLISFLQAWALQREGFRKFFKMTPLPKRTPKPLKDVVYKGRANIVLTQAELTSRFQGADSSSKNVTSASAFQGKVNEIRDLKPPSSSRWKIQTPKIVKKAVDGVMSNDGLGGAVKGVIDKGKQSARDRKEKGEKEDLKRYEKKRQEEIRKERWELENLRRAERAEKRLRDSERG